MSAEHGQASIEWIGLVLLVALALAALAGPARLAGGGGGGADIALAGLRATTSGTEGPSAAGRPRGAVTVPPLLPPPALGDAPHAGRARRQPLVPPRVRALLRARFGAVWRRAWLACFAYERVRYALLHPETRVRQNVPIRDALRMVNDCLIPIDLMRDWERQAPR